jgi:hypothetical protein
MTMTDHVRLGPEDKDLVGAWVRAGTEVQGDATCKRIKTLISTNLRLLGHAEGGWSALYQDPGDGRLWELTYPHSEMHGGGPPRLTWISQEQAESKYGQAG